MQIKYRGGVRELIWAMTTCQTDIAFTTVKLSQSNSNLAEHHFHGLKHAIRYLYSTRMDGIYFWRTGPCSELPDGPLPNVNSTIMTSSLTISHTTTLLLLLRAATPIGLPV